ncbi:hypothetical protein P9869_31550 [Streptomyces ossamyceticus]|nr:hypothetical protein [Streptomyces ossamyceticus]
MIPDGFGQEKADEWRPASLDIRGRTEAAGEAGAWAVPARP